MTKEAYVSTWMSGLESGYLTMFECVTKVPIGLEVAPELWDPPLAPMREENTAALCLGLGESLFKIINTHYLLIIKIYKKKKIFK